MITAAHHNRSLPVRWIARADFICAVHGNVKTGQTLEYDPTSVKQRECRDTLRNIGRIAPAPPPMEPRRK